MEVKSVFCPLILCTEWQAVAALLPCAAVSLPSAPPCAAVKGRTYRTNKHPASRVYVCEVPDKARRHAHSRQQRNWCFHDFQPAPRILEAADCGLDVAMIARTGTATHTNVAASLPLSTKLSDESCGARTRQTVSCIALTNPRSARRSWRGRQTTQRTCSLVPAHEVPPAHEEPMQQRAASSSYRVMALVPCDPQRARAQQRPRQQPSFG